MMKKKKLRAIIILAVLLLLSLIVFRMVIAGKNTSPVSDENGAIIIEVPATDDGLQTDDKNGSEKEVQEYHPDLGLEDNEESDREQDHVRDETEDEEGRIREDNQLPEIPG